MLVVECEYLSVPGGILEHGPFYVTVEGERITGVLRQQPPRLAAEANQWLHTYLLTPGFIDLHTHGVGEHLLALGS